MTPEFDWYFNRETRRYVIRRNGRTWQEIMVNRHNPAHTVTYVQRCVDELNKEK